MSVHQSFDNTEINAVYLISWLHPSSMRYVKVVSEICKSPLDVNQMSISLAHFQSIVYETWNLKWLQQIIFPSIIILVCGQRKQKPNISPAIASLKCVIRFLSIALQKVICIRESRRKFETISISVMSLKWWQNTSMSTLIGTIIPFHNINQVKIFLGMRNSVELQFTKWVEFVFMTIE